MKNTGSLNLSEPQEDSKDTTIKTISCELSNSRKSNQNDDSKEPVWKWRYVMALIGFFIHFLGTTNRTIMSVAIVAMVNHTAVGRISKSKSDSCPNLIKNYSGNDTVDGIKLEGEFLWSPEIQGYILGCVFIGNIIILMPASALVERYGCKWIFVGTFVSLSILTMLIPPLAKFGASAVIILQTLRGLILGLPGPGIPILIANWSPKKERGFLYSIIQPAHFLGPALGNILAGYISESSAGWPYSFYILGALCLILVIFILFFLTDSPKEHPRISKAELNYILSQQENKLSRRRPKLPWRQLLTSVPLYGLIIVVFGRAWTVSQFWLVHSTFLGTILHYPIGQNGLFTAIPNLVAFFTSTLASSITGYVEKRELVPVNTLRKFWILLSSILSTSCILGMYIVGCNRDLSTILAILSFGLGGLGGPGSMVVLQDMSPTFAGTLYSITASIGGLSSVILPLCVGYLTNETQTLEQWNKVFFITIGVVMSSTIFFLIFGSARIQPWNFVEEENKKKEETHHESDKNDEMSRF